MNSIYWMIMIYIFFMFTTVVLSVFIFPFRRLLLNRWKLKIMTIRKAVTPVFIIYKNNHIEEVIVDTTESTFSHKESTYNIRPLAFHTLFGFKYCLYLHDKPEPLMPNIDKLGLVYFKTVDGKPVEVPVVELFQRPDGQYIAAKIIDGKTYNNLLIRAYNAGMAWMARNKNIVQMLLYILLFLSLAGFAVIYWHQGAIQQQCAIFYTNITSTLQTNKVL